LTVTNRADVHLTLLSSAPALRHGDRVRVHAGSSELTARVSIAATRRLGADAWIAVQPGDAGVQIEPGASAFVRLRFAGPAVLTRGDRIILRASSPLVTIGGATVLDAEPPVSGVRRETALARFDRLDGPDLPIAFLLAERGEAGLGMRDLVRRWGLDVPRADAIIDSILREGRGVRVGDKVVDSGIVARWDARVVEVLELFHRTHPLEPGLTPGAIRDKSGGRAQDALIATVLGRLAERHVTRGSDRVALSSHVPGVSPEQQALQSRVERAILEGALAPPDPAEVASTVGATTAAVDRAIQWLLREKRLVRAGDLLFHTEALGVLKGAVQSQRSGTPVGARVTLDVGTFKARFNLTRKHAIPLLEWLDRERVTRRMGDVRIVL
jgi:selenocysteine-specific elongation factor